MPAIPITYCTNVHPGARAADVLAAMAGPVAGVAASAREAGGAFPLGSWWSRAFVAELRADPDARARYREALAGLRMTQATVNVFPAGDFHQTRVKETVYRPDWADEERVRYTCDAADLLADLLPPHGQASLSTVPLGFDPQGAAPGAQRRMARNLLRVASHLRAVADRTGCSLVLALEPEPACLLETVAGAVAFLEDRIFGDGALDVREEVLREHLGLCIDLCHLAVVGEDPVAALDRCTGAGIRVGKVQVSCALEARLRHGRDAALNALLAFREPRYLHQSGGFAAGAAAPALRALDLPDVAAARDRWSDCDVVRSHFHVPVFWDEPGPLGSTRAQVERFLAHRDLRRTVPLLEVETYTWGVLPAERFAHDEAALVAGIARELAFVRERASAHEPAG